MCNVFLGMLFLKEHLRPLQILAVVLSGIGEGYLTVCHGAFPWTALSLAFSFGCYGLIRKIAPVGAREGLAVETLLLSLPAAAYLFYLYRIDSGALFHWSIQTDLLLMETALVTAFPLLFFTLGARRLQLSTLGFLQYIAPSCTFLLAVFIYHEPFKAAHLWTFILIWSALAIFSGDACLYYRGLQSRS